MSYDIFVIKFAEIYDLIEDIPDDAESVSLGSANKVRDAVNQIFPGTDWADSSWGNWESEIGSVEFNLGADDTVMSLALHIRAQDLVMGAVVKLCRDHQWQGMDGEADFIENRATPEQALKDWSAFRDFVLKG